LRRFLFLRIFPLPAVYRFAIGERILRKIYSRGKKRLLYYPLLPFGKGGGLGYKLIYSLKPKVGPSPGLISGGKERGGFGQGALGGKGLTFLLWGNWWGKPNLEKRDKPRILWGLGEIQTRFLRNDLSGTRNFYPFQGIKG